MGKALQDRLDHLSAVRAWDQACLLTSSAILDARDPHESIHRHEVGSQEAFFEKIEDDGLEDYVVALRPIPRVASAIHERRVPLFGELLDPVLDRANCRERVRQFGIVSCLEALARLLNSL